AYVEQVLAWGLSLEWYAHDGNLDGALTTALNVVPDLGNPSTTTLPVDVSAFLDHGIFGEPRLLFAAEASVDGEGDPLETEVYEAFDPQEVDPTGKWSLIITS